MFEHKQERGFLLLLISLYFLLILIVSIRNRHTQPFMQLFVDKLYLYSVLCLFNVVIRQAGPQQPLADFYQPALTNKAMYIYVCMYVIV